MKRQSRGGFRIWAVGGLAFFAGCAAVGAVTDAPDALLPSLQVYASGGEATFVLQVTNTSGSAVDVDFSSGQSFDFVVQDGDRAVWRWSDGQMFTQALRRDRLAPSESWMFEATWRVPPGVGGDLVAVGTLTASSHRIEQAARFRLP